VFQFGPYENGWQYVLMSRLRGEDLAHAWVVRIPQLHRERLTNSYGHAFEPTELLAYTLQHVYSNLPWYMRSWAYRLEERCIRSLLHGSALQRTRSARPSAPSPGRVRTAAFR
jgi:hypothetical protein